MITLTQILKILLIGVTGTLVINVTKCQNFRFIVHLVFSVPKLFCEIWKAFKNKENSGNNREKIEIFANNDYWHVDMIRNEIIN